MLTVGDRGGRRHTLAIVDVVVGLTGCTRLSRVINCAIGHLVGGVNGDALVGDGAEVVVLVTKRAVALESDELAIGLVSHRTSVIGEFIILGDVTERAFVIRGAFQAALGASLGC